MKFRWPACGAGAATGAWADIPRSRSKAPPQAAGGAERGVRVRGCSPLPQFALARGPDRVAIHIPRTTQHFSVDLIDWTKSFSPQALREGS